jgi:tetratricopeptide (TPR) repeat protein
VCGVSGCCAPAHSSRPLADVFVVNQHADRKPDAGAGRRYYMDTFAAAVGTVGHTLLVLQPWDTPLPLTRAWCLWEIFSALQSATGRLEVVMGPAEEAALQEALATRYKEVVAAVSRIDARNAAATDGDDAAAIKALVTQSAGGFGEVNGRVHDFLRGWLVSCGEAALLRARAAAAEPPGAQSAGTLRALATLGKLLCHQGRVDEARPLLQEALDAYGAIGADAPQPAASSACGPPTCAEALEVARSLAKIMDDRAAAITLMQGTVRDSAATFGATHVETLLCRYMLGVLFVRSDALDDADSHLTAALSGLLAMPGTKEEALLCMSWLGILRGLQLSEHYIAGRHKDATALLLEPLRLCGDACDGMRALLGDAHPATWYVMSMHVDRLRFVASIVRSGFHAAATVSPAELLDTAHKHIAVALQGQRETLGNTHPATRATELSLVELLLEAGKLADAERVCRTMLPRDCGTLGDCEDTLTLAAAGELACILVQQERHSEAEALRRELLRNSRRTLGDAHDESLKAVETLAGVLQAQGKWDDADALYREALLACSETAHAPSARSISLLTAHADALAEQGRPADALAAAKDALRQKAAPRWARRTIRR